MFFIPIICALIYNYLDKHKCLSKRIELYPFLLDVSKVFNLLQYFDIYVPY